MVVEESSDEALAVEARGSLSTYCFTECRAYCCRKGFLLLDEKELPMFHARKEDLRVITTDVGQGKEGYVFDLGADPFGCPNLCKFTCTIHKNPLRPKTCSDFPLFLWADKTVMVTRVCPAVKENMLYPYLAEFKRRGYSIVYRNGKA